MKPFIFLTISLIAIQSLSAQPQPQHPPILPKHEIEKPVATIKNYPVLSQYVTIGSWKADVWWTTSEAGHSSTIPEIIFTLNGESIWQSPFQEIVLAQTGTFMVDGNDFAFSFNYNPYKYTFKGTYNNKSGKITSTFTQTKMKILNTPAGYTSGTITGSFTMSKK